MNGEKEEFVFFRHTCNICDSRPKNVQIYVIFSMSAVAAGVYHVHVLYKTIVEDQI